MWGLFAFKPVWGMAFFLVPLLIMLGLSFAQRSTYGGIAPIAVGEHTHVQNLRTKRW